MPAFLPNSLTRTRPRLVCEIRATSVSAGRADEDTGLLSQLSHTELSDNNREALVSALRKTLGNVSGRSRDCTLVLPDSAVRVLLLDFDSFPSKAAEALPVVRFRLARLLPFDAQTAAVSYQIVSQTKTAVQLLVVALPQAVLEQYESAVRDAGYEPGSVLPSSLAVIGALAITEPVLLINSATDALTAAIVRRGDVLLHRTIALEGDIAGEDISAQALAEEEIARTISVTAAFYEDTLGVAPRQVFVAGDRTREVEALVKEMDLEPREIVTSSDMATAVPGNQARSMFAALRGAVAS